MGVSRPGFGMCVPCRRPDIRKKANVINQIPLITRSEVPNLSDIPKERKVG